MANLTNINPVYIVVGGVLITAYYVILIIYDRKIKNKKYIKNINDKASSVNNIHIFENNFESAPSYNKVKIKPAIISKETNDDRNDWKKTLGIVQAQSEELNTNNSLDQILFDNDIDIDS